MRNPASTKPKGTSRTRIGRFSEKSRVYHVNTATHRRRKIFADLIKGRQVVQALMCEQRHAGSVTLAFVVMPDHLHWLVSLDGERSLSETVCIVKSHAARTINALNGSIDRIWQRGFYDRAVRKEDDLINIARYIVANPLRAGLVKCVWQYPLWDAVWL